MNVPTPTNAIGMAIDVILSAPPCICTSCEIHGVYSVAWLLYDQKFARIYHENLTKGALRAGSPTLRTALPTHYRCTRFELLGLSKSPEQ